MKEIFGVWGKTRQIVIIAITAAIYAGTLIPFKPIQIVPGLTELRPASVIPVLFGIMFGPAAAWGAAIGNLIADFFGMLSPASAFGFIGNFLYAYLAYKIWNSMVKGEIKFNEKQYIEVLILGVIFSPICALIVWLGMEFLKLNLFALLFLSILINNLAISLIRSDNDTKAKDVLMLIFVSVFLGLVSTILTLAVSKFEMNLYVVIAIIVLINNLIMSSIGEKFTSIFILASAVSSLACALTVGFGVWLFKLAPFLVVFLVVFINNTLMASVLGIILMKLLYKRVEKTGLMERE
jgi:hypothetical protein